MKDVGEDFKAQSLDSMEESHSGKLMVVTLIDDFL
jgi:hypothetical protein